MRRLSMPLAFFLFLSTSLMLVIVLKFDAIRFARAHENPVAVDHDIIDIIRGRLVLPSRLATSLSDRTNRSNFAEVGQSAYVDKLLRGRRNGFFVECGAGDGEHFSNSLFFELRRNWTGILIEANPFEYGQVLAKHRKAYTLSACLNVERRASLMKMRLAGDSGGLVGTLNRFQMKIDKVVEGKDLDVPCYPLNWVLDAVGIIHVDYFSLDVEGAELGVLKTIDWSRVRIDVITVEIHIGGLPASDEGRAEKQHKYDAISEFLKSTGLYKQVSFMPVRVNEATRAYDVVFARLDLET